MEKVKVNVTQVTKDRAIKALTQKGHDLEIDWETAYNHNGSGTKVSVKCNKCGTVDEAILSNLVKGARACRGCTLRKRINKIFDANMEVEDVYMVKKKWRYLLKCNKCGTLSVKDDQQIMQTKLKCVVCDKPEDSVKTYWKEKSSVYLIKLQVSDDHFIYKIGTASDPAKRAAYLKLNGPYEVFTLSEFNTRHSADALESELHKQFSTHRLCWQESSKYTGRYSYRKLPDGSRMRVKGGVTEWFSHHIIYKLQERFLLEKVQQLCKEN